MKLLKDVGLTAIVISVFLVFAEFSLRFAGVKYDGGFYRHDRDLGYTLEPAVQGWNVKEHAAYVRINSKGLRDREHSIQRPQDVIRIALVGDSYAEARHVNQDAAFWSVMERELNGLLASQAQRVEVLNFGVGGYSLPQEYVLIKERIWQYDPQIVLLAGSLHSFVTEGSRKLRHEEITGSIPFFEFRNGNLTLDEIATRDRNAFVPDSRFHPALANLKNASRLISLAYDGAVTIWRLVLHRPTADQAAAKYANSEMRGPASADDRDAYKISEELIRRCQTEATRHHAEFWLFTLDMPPQTDPDPNSRAEFKRKMGIDDLFLADNTFANFADREGILHGALAPGMLAFAERNHVVLHGFTHPPQNTGHWNETGHRIAGQLIAKELFDCSSVIPGNRRSCLHRTN